MDSSPLGETDVSSAPGAPGGTSPAPGVMAAVFVPLVQPEHMLVTAQALLRAEIPAVVGSPDPSTLGRYVDLGFEAFVAADAAEVVNLTWAQYGVHVLALADALTLPDGFLDSALPMLDEDLRVATVSFLSNDAAFLSFPVRNTPAPTPPPGQDARTMTQLLRQRPPAAPAANLPIAAGAAVLLSASGLGTMGPLLSSPQHQLASSLAEYSARCRTRGFLHLLDPSTYYIRHRSITDLSDTRSMINGLDEAENAWNDQRHPYDYEFVVHQATAGESPVGAAIRLARVKSLGLRILVDGATLGPHEMGTQVAATSIVSSLAQRDDVSDVTVILRSEAPPYARAVLAQPKVHTVVSPHGTLEQVGRFDVFHRPIQPDQHYRADEWRTVAQRVVVTALDLIAYRIGSYHKSVADWFTFRSSFENGIRASDGVVVISHDVADQLRLDMLPVDRNRLCVAPLGTEHLSADAPAVAPQEITRRGLVASEFVLCLGTDYTHKNRDLAIATVAELRRRGWPHTLVMAGPSILFGSSRDLEARTLLEGRNALSQDDVLVLPDLPSAERNWLLRHASVVLYPTSAEGFGLVPYEAARLGTPTVFVGFGPLADVEPGPPVVSEDWRPSGLADATEALLLDPHLAKQQIEAALAAEARFSWTSVAEILTSFYRHLLTLPAR